MLLCCALLGCQRAPARWPGSSATAFPCSAESDSDRDGLGDDCELRLARAFAPELRVNTRACNWDNSLQPARPGGEYYFGAEARDARTVRLVYLPAYYQDCGYSGTQCLLPLVNCDGHSGDSEFIAIDIAQNEHAEWQVTGIFLSAHCFDRSGADCRWFRAAQLAQFSWTDQQRLAPVIWVAAGKNANYPTQAACNRGHWRFDDCADNKNRLRYPIASARQNIGSRTLPAGDAQGCVRAGHAGWQSARTDANARECLWSDSIPFTGWQRPSSRHATSYARYLREIAQFR